MPRWEALAQATWCEACVRSGTGHDIVHVNAISGTGFASMAVKSMQLMDWLALVFASILLGLAVNGELKVRSLKLWYDTVGNSYCRHSADERKK